MTDRGKAISQSRDAAQQIVTALLGGDQNLAKDIIIDFDHMHLLAMVLADLTAGVHMAWCRTTVGEQYVELAWQNLLLDIAEYREEIGDI